MAGLLEDLLSGRSSDIYGNGLLTPEQRGGLGNIGLLALAGKLGQLAGPSFSPVPDFGAALGQAAGAYGASQEGAGTAALNAILTAQKGRKLQQELDYYQKLGPVLGRLAGQWPGADGGAGGGEGSGSTGGGAAAPPGAGGGGGSGSASEAANLVGNYESEGLAKKLGISPYNIAYGGKDLSNAPRDENGFPQWEGKDNSHAAGRYQFQPGTWARYAKPLGITDFSPASQDKVFEAAYADKGFGHWAPYNPALAAAIGTRGAAPTAAAPVGAGTSGFLAPTAAAPAGGGGLLNLPQVPNATREFGGITPSAGAGDAAAALNPLRNPNLLYRLRDSRVPFGAGDGSAASSGSSAGGAPQDIYAGTDPITSVTSADQAGGGDAPGGMASGLLTPGGPLTRGVPGMPAMPAATAPSPDPSLQLGPLAAPAPAAAAPAAPGPGLLSPPGMPAAAALPRVNPAFDTYLRNLGVAGALAKGAGLPDVLGPLTGAFKDSPAYQQQLEIAKRTAAQPFEQAQTLYNKQVEIAGVGPIEAAKLPYALAQTYFKAEQDIRTAGPIAAAQNFERIKADNAPKGIITTRDADGNIKIAIDPDVVKAVTGATITAPEQAKADIARETTRIQQTQQAALDLAKQREQVGSIDPIKARNEVLAGEYKETVSAADAASKAKVPLTQIENAMPDFRTGQTAQTRLTLAKTWQDFASNIGLPPNSDLARMIASGEIINKSGTTLGFELARTLGSREAQNIVQQAVAANPGLAVSPGGNKELIGLIKQGLQRDIDKREYFDNHFRQYGSYDRAATEFNRTNPVEKYVSQILPYTVSTPADAAKLPPGTRFKSPNDPSGLVRTVPER